MQLTQNNILRAYALKLLARREYSRAELERKLYCKISNLDLDFATVLHLLQQLNDEGLQSDVRFCQMFIRTKMNAGYGPLWIKAALRQRGIGDALIELHLPRQESDWWPVLEMMYQKKYRTHAQLSIERDPKIIQFFLRRGFLPETVYRFINFNLNN